MSVLEQVELLVAARFQVRQVDTDLVDGERLLLPVEAQRCYPEYLRRRAQHTTGSERHKGSRTGRILKREEREFLKI